MRKSNYGWVVVGIFFLFMLLHQTDKLMIGPLADIIMKEFQVDYDDWGTLTSITLLVGTILYPIWGYLFDRYARSKLLAAAALIWGSTTTLNALAPNFNIFRVTRAATGIDDSSYPGLYSLITDYFPPTLRGRIYGTLQLTQPIGYLLGMILGLLLSGVMGWRGLFLVTGGLGIVLSIVMYLGLREAPRGQSEPEMEGIQETIVNRFEWGKLGQAVSKPSLILVYIQGFFGVFPWNAITYFFFVYLQRERKYNEGEVLMVMAVAVLVLAAGYPLGGFLGDFLFKRTPSGRAYVGSFGVLMGALLFYLTLTLPHTASAFTFMGLLAVSAIFIPLASPNVIGIVNDVTLPEVRSTAVAVENFLENIGAAASPAIVGFIAVRSDLQTAFLWICTSTWILCGIIFFVAARLVPHDVNELRQEMRRRADAERAAQANARDTKDAGQMPSPAGH